MPYRPCGRDCLSSGSTVPRSSYRSCGRGRKRWAKTFPASEQILNAKVASPFGRAAPEPSSSSAIYTGLSANESALSSHPAGCSSMKHSPKHNAHFLMGQTDRSFSSAWASCLNSLRASRWNPTKKSKPHPLGPKPSRVSSHESRALPNTTKAESLTGQPACLGSAPAPSARARPASHLHCPCGEPRHRKAPDPRYFPQPPRRSGSAHDTEFF